MPFQIPTLNAALNAASAVCLLAGGWAILTKRVLLHRRLMKTAFAISVAFLISYLAYHARAGSTRFTGTGTIRSAYFAILISHTILAAVIVPMILRTLFLASRARFEEHRKWARWTWPLWTYVSVTGVIVYWMLYRRGA
jgi:putative membrane protein